jgi:crotonobetainyl-CoA hydratase
MSEAVRSERRGQVLEITLDRPKANAIDVATSRRLGEIFRGFAEDPELRVAIVTAAGERFFSAGWDLKAAAGGEEVDTDFGPGGFAGIHEIMRLDKPVIAAVNGLAIGGGFELALAADLMVAAEQVEFALPETMVGVVADVGTVLLPRRMPRAVALELLLTGRRMGAAEAERWGLVNAVVPAGELMARARALAELIVPGAPLSVAAIKALARQTETLTFAESMAGIEAGRFEAYERMLASEDAREGPRAFAEKRTPVWRGR